MKGVGYFYECPSCSKVHGIERPDRFSAAALAHERQCDKCGQDGCSDCIPNAVCSTCAHDADYTGLDYKCDPPCLACLNNWSHG